MRVTRAGLTARALLTLGALLPYWRLLTFHVVLVTDDHFSSDVFDGELPVRLIVGRALRAGHWPLWTGQLCSGLPLVGLPADPLGLALFWALPPAPALDLYLLLLLLIAAHGTYALARRFGADRIGAVLAGIAFAGSGHLVGQLKHLSILSTIVWLPCGWVLIDRAIAAANPARSKRPLNSPGVLVGALGLVFANQVLSGFPQAAYICGLTYALFALFRIIAARRTFENHATLIALLASMSAAMVLGIAAGAIVLSPLSEIAGASDRAGALDYRWATYTSYWPPDVFTFFVPYINGDVSNGTYVGSGQPFSESYGYLGVLTAVLAIWTAVRERRRPPVAFLILTTLVAFMLMLGARTPVYYAAHVLVPGMNRFRAPTRFLVVIELSLALLAAIGLTRVRARFGRSIAVAICVVTALDLLVHQPRQNPMVPADQWLAAPATVAMVRGDTAAPRTLSPHHRDIHRNMYDHDEGWTDLRPYFAIRDLLEPNTGAYWNVPSADCYVGLPPRWYVSVWGYHYFESSLVSELAFEHVETRTLDVKRGFAKLLGMYGVTHVVSPYPGGGDRLTPIGRTATAYLYRVEGAARVRVVPSAVSVPNEDRAGLRMHDPSFDPDHEVLLMDDAGSPRIAVPRTTDADDTAAGRATITSDRDDDLVIDAYSPRDAVLLLSDTYFPGWRAEVDGAETPIQRADISLRAIALPEGHHTVRFVYHPASLYRAVPVSLAALCALVAWIGIALYRVYA
jgi:hypothetical protein